MERRQYHFDNIYQDMTTVVGPYILYQLGDLSVQPGYDGGEHVQRVHEITYVVSGRGKMWIGDECTELRPRMVAVNRIGDRHRICADSIEGLRFFYLGFSFAERNQSESTQLIERFFRQPSDRFVSDAPDLQDAFIAFFSELLLRDAMSDVMAEACMQRIVCGTWRLFTRKDPAHYRFGLPRTADESLVYDVVHHIDHQAGEPGLLSGLGEKFGYSYAHIARQFARVTGRSLRDYYSQRRFELACEHLRGGASVTAVSERMGYKSIHAFSNAFKKHLGESPSAYLKRIENH